MKTLFVALFLTVAVPAEAGYLTHYVDCEEDGGPRFTVFNDHRIKINDGAELFTGEGVGNNGAGFNYVKGNVRAFLKTNCVIRSSHSKTCTVLYTADSGSEDAVPYSCTVRDKR